MEIRINGQIADISLETEKTVGEIMAGLEHWLDNSGHRLSGLVIDGEIADSGSLEDVFARELNSVKTLDIRTSSLAELAAQSLSLIYRDSEEYENLDFDEKQRYHDIWAASPQALYIAEQMPDFFPLCDRVFSGGDISPQVLRSIIEERLRELEDPSGELAALEPLVSEADRRLLDLPLDIQTGKDACAAQTIQIFSSVAEKLFRIIGILKAEGFMPDETASEQNGLAGRINEFGTAVNEMLTAYTQSDMVLVGDLAEYELAPRLRDLYDAIMKIPSQPAAASG